MCADKSRVRDLTTKLFLSLLDTLDFYAWVGWLAGFIKEEKFFHSLKWLSPPVLATPDLSIRPIQLCQVLKCAFDGRSLTHFPIFLHSKLMIFFSFNTLTPEQKKCKLTEHDEIVLSLCYSGQEQFHFPSKCY